MVHQIKWIVIIKFEFHDRQWKIILDRRNQRRNCIHIQIYENKHKIKNLLKNEFKIQKNSKI
jgi:hypothetical protein